MYNYLVKEFVTYCKNGCVIQQDILVTETGNGPFRYTHPSPVPPALCFLFGVWYVQKNTWAPSGGHSSVSTCLTLQLKFLVTWRKMFG